MLLRALALLLLPGLAVADGRREVHAGWDLAPWRTWVVLEHVEASRAWFRTEALPDLGRSCVVAVSLTEGRATVRCDEGVDRRGDARAVRGKAKRAARIAADALEEQLGTQGAEAAAGLTFLGFRQALTVRELVLMDGDSAPGTARSMSRNGTWLVDDDGAVLPPDHPVEARFVPACAPGLHTGCDAPPRLLPFEPSQGWEGFLVEEDPEGMARLGAALREVARDEARRGWVAPPPRPTDDAILPASYDAAMELRVRVRVRRLDGTGGEVVVPLGVPVTDAAEGPVGLELALDGLDARLDVDVRLDDARVRLSLTPPDGAPQALDVGLHCDVVQDGPRAALVGPCTVDSEGRWLTWFGEGGRAQVVAQLLPDVIPGSAPSRGLGLAD